MTEFQNTPWPRGCLQIYTGTGKGKTTAALGLAFRAAGRGIRTFVGQFMKGSPYGELGAVEMLGGLVKIEQFGSSECIALRDEPDERDLCLARAGLARCWEVMQEGAFQIMVLDEVNVALGFHLLEESDVLELVDSRPEVMELVCTGRGAPGSLIDRTANRSIAGCLMVSTLPWQSVR